MSIKELQHINKQIQGIYMGTCQPCMKNPEFRKGNCARCDVMAEYIGLQNEKKVLMGLG